MTFGVRELVTLALLSVLLVALSATTFRANAASRRLFVIVAGSLFAGLPPLLSLLSVTWQVAVADPPGWLTGQLVSVGLPTALPTALFLSGLLLALCGFAHVCLVRRQLDVLPHVQDVQVLQIADEYQHALRSRREVQFREGLAPCSTSLGRALVILPHGWRSWPAGTLSVVIAHELVHVARRDDVWLQLLRLLRMGYWWLPWLGLLTRHFEQAMEESCDDLAAALVASDTDYLHGVMQVARGDHGPPAYALPNLATHPLLERFRRFRQFRERETDFRGLYWSSLLLAASITLLWTVEVVERPAGAAPLRIIGVVAPAEAETFDVKLAPRERAPPRLDPALR